jgi:CBS domain-containing protein
MDRSAAQPARCGAAGLGGSAMHRLRQVFQRQRVISADPDTSVHEVAVLMTRSRIGAIPILRGEELLGIFSERDLMTRVVVAGRDPKTTRVSEVMTTQVVTATLQEHVDYCLDKMKRVGCRHLPVVADGKLIGMLSMRDLLRDEIAEQSQEIAGLKAYLHQQPM